MISKSIIDSINADPILFILENDASTIIDIIVYANDQYYNDMMLLHVLIHEICHCLCDEIGHTEKFNDMLDELLDEASKMGVYDKNYKLIQNYCTYNDK